MGICASGTSNRDAAEKNTAINKALIEDKTKLENEIKLLLLGAGESGKSTIAKQMRILHKQGFTNEEKASYKTIIFNNIVGSMRVLINAAAELNVQISPDHKKAVDSIVAVEEYFTGDLTPEIASAVSTLWMDSGIKEVFARSAEFQLNDSAKYYFDNVQRIASPEYVPDEQDILRSRAKTTGIIEIEFEIEKFRFRVVDVGGQRSERKKWMHCFQEVTAVIFCVAMSEYDLKLYEEDTTNRMHESLKLFKEVCQNKWFTEASIILFLNKKDLFEEKIKRVDLSVCFPSYTGGSDFSKASEYMQEQFLRQNENAGKQIYPHITCATDTSNVQHVFDSVKDTVIQTAVRQSGL